MWYTPRSGRCPSTDSTCISTLMRVTFSRIFMRIASRTTDLIVWCWWFQCKKITPRPD